jgi:hypothetical protein
LPALGRAERREHARSVRWWARSARRSWVINAHSAIRAGRACGCDPYTCPDAHSRAAKSRVCGCDPPSPAARDDGGMNITIDQIIVTGRTHLRRLPAMTAAARIAAQYAHFGTPIEIEPMRVPSQGVTDSPLERRPSLGAPSEGSGTIGGWHGGAQSIAVRGRDGRRKATAVAPAEYPTGRSKIQGDRNVARHAPPGSRAADPPGSRDQDEIAAGCHGPRAVVRWPPVRTWPQW